MSSRRDNNKERTEADQHLGRLKAVERRSVGVVDVLRVMSHPEHLPALLVEGRREVGRLEL